MEMASFPDELAAKVREGLRGVVLDLSAQVRRDVREELRLFIKQLPGGGEVCTDIVSSRRSPKPAFQATESSTAKSAHLFGVMPTSPLEQPAFRAQPGEVLISSLVDGCEDQITRIADSTTAHAKIHVLGDENEVGCMSGVPQAWTHNRRELHEWLDRFPRGFLASKELGVASQSCSLLERGSSRSVKLLLPDEESNEGGRAGTYEDSNAGAKVGNPCDASACTTNVSRHPKLAVSNLHGIRRRVARLVVTESFDCVILALVLLNAVCIGWQADSEASSDIDHNVFSVWRVIDCFFAIVFLSELFLRVYVYRSLFFSMPGWLWNIFDAIIVVLQVLEALVTALASAEFRRSAVLLRLLKAGRLLRITRVVRVLHLVRDLRVAVGSLAGCLQPFFATILLFMLVIYIVGVYMFLIVMEHRLEHQDDYSAIPGLQVYWGSLGQSVLSLFQSVTGGVDWDDVVRPLMEFVSPWMALLYSFYVAFALFVMLNLVTGIFFDLTFTKIRENKDRELINQVHELFWLSDQNRSGEVTWEEFECQLSNPRMRECFKIIDLDLSEARGLFRMLDRSERGFITLADFVMGCLRLRGPARAIDLAILMHGRKQERDTLQMMQSSMAAMQRHLARMSEALSSSTKMG